MVRASQPLDILTASQLAAFCDVDLKTIHNWAERGRVRCSRTPGRHLRIRRVDALDFLRRYGYHIPDELLRGLPQVWDLSSCLGEHELQRLRGALEVNRPRDLASALIELGSDPPDALVLAADSSGLPATMLIRAVCDSAATRHVRVVVYTPHEELRKDVLDAGAIALVAAPDAPGLEHALCAALGIGR